MRGNVVLPRQGSFGVEELSISDGCPIRFDGKTLAFDVWLRVLTGVKRIDPCLARLHLEVYFYMHVAWFRGIIDTSVTVHRRY